MAKENAYKNTLSQLSDKLKSESPKTPIQEVRPVEQAPTVIPVSTATALNKGKSAGEAHLNCWIPNELMQQLKIHAAKSGKSIKQISIEALELYLPVDN